MPGPKREKCPDHRQNQSTGWRIRLRTLFPSIVPTVDSSVQYGIPGLKRVALRGIKSGLDKCDIVQEAFSLFTSRCAQLASSLTSRRRLRCVHRYSEIRTMQVNHLLRIWLSAGEESKVVRKKLEEKIDSYAAGKLDHAVDTILHIWQISNEQEGEGELVSSNFSGSVSTRSIKPSSSDATRFMGCDIRFALVKSIQEGHLLDRKYWARRSREGGIEPVYFFNAATCAELLSFDTCEPPHHGDSLNTKLCSIGAPSWIRRAHLQER